MRNLVFALLLCASTLVRAVYQDEVGHIDYHYELLGVPQRENTFFHRPRPEDRASLLYALSDVGVLGAVNPTNGAVVWRQQLGGRENNNISIHGGGSLRPIQGSTQVVAAYDGSVHAWNAATGRNEWWLDHEGELKDLEILGAADQGGMKGAPGADVLLLLEDGGSSVLRRLNGNTGQQKWEHRDASKDVPLQVQSDGEQVFMIGLHGGLLSYTLKVTTFDAASGALKKEVFIGTKGSVSTFGDITYVGANRDAPFMLWTNKERTKFLLNKIGQESVQEFTLPAGTLGVEVDTTNLAGGSPHFLVRSFTSSGGEAHVFHINPGPKPFSLAYELLESKSLDSLSTSANGATAYLTSIDDNEVSVRTTTKNEIVARWPLRMGNYSAALLHAASEVVYKLDGTYAVRVAAVTGADDWIMLRNGEMSWSRPEGMTAATAAIWAELPESADLARSLETEAHSNPWSAYVHRVQRHFDDLRKLPDYLASLPARLLSGLFGVDSEKTAALSRDSFGFNKIILLATKRGRLYGLSSGHVGRMLWTRKAFDVQNEQEWAVKGIDVDNVKGTAAFRGADGEYIIVNTTSGKAIETMPPGSWPAVEGTAQVDTPSGRFMLTVGTDGKIGDIPAAWTPSETVVVRDGSNGLRGLKFVKGGANVQEETTWSFSLPPTEKLIDVATRPAHDPVASIGRVKGDRTVRYKYLTANIALVAGVNEAASTLTTYLLDTISGELLSSATYEGVDTSKTVDITMSENWFAVTFFGQYRIQDSRAQAIKGYQIVVTDLFESDLANDRGPLGGDANLSSIHPFSAHTGESFLPSLATQTYILGGTVSALAVTETRQGITSRQLLAYLAESQSILAIPRHILEPRRVVGRDPTAMEQEEGLMRYHPAIEIDPKNVITHQRDVMGIEGIITSPAIVESTSLVFAYGIDVFVTRVAPSYTFDILGKGFNKITLSGTVLALMAGVLALAPVVKRRQINLRWRPST